MIPSIRDDRGNPRLPAGIDFDVRIKGGQRWRLTTDDTGARIDPSLGSGSTSASGGILVVGDSQSLGWDMPLESTYGARLAARLGMPTTQVRLLAAAALDPETSLHWVREDAVRHPQRSRLAVVAINLGNDFEEMYFGRVNLQMTPTPALTRTLTAHSVLYLDAALMRHYAGARFGDDLPPGVNVAMASLDAPARQRLVTASADAVQRLVKALPPADRTLVVGVPQDTQVDEREFAKYRVYYRSDAEFEKFRAMQKVAATRLDEAGNELATALKARGIDYLGLDAPLRKAYLPAGYIDAASHHLLAPAHTVVGNAIAAHLDPSSRGTGVASVRP